MAQTVIDRALWYADGVGQAGPCVASGVYGERLHSDELGDLLKPLVGLVSDGLVVVVFLIQTESSFLVGVYQIGHDAAADRLETNPHLGLVVSPGSRLGSVVAYDVLVSLGLVEVRNVAAHGAEGEQIDIDCQLVIFAEILAYVDELLYGVELYGPL